MTAPQKKKSDEPGFFLEFEERPGTYLFTRPARPHEVTLSGKVSYLMRAPTAANGYTGTCQCHGFAVRKTCRHLDLLQQTLEHK